MNLKQLVEFYQKKLKENPNDLSCLLFALQIPSICSRIIFPPTDENTGNVQDEKLYTGKNKRPNDKNLYLKWMEDNRPFFDDISKGYKDFKTFCNFVYELRCQLTHEGILMKKTKKTANNNKFVFISEKEGGMFYKNTLYISIQWLCEDMFDAVDSDFLNVYSNESNSYAYENLLVTPYKDIFIPLEEYRNIVKDTKKSRCCK